MEATGRRELRCRVGIANGVERTLRLAVALRRGSYGKTVWSRHLVLVPSFTAEGELNRDTLPGMCFFTLIGAALGQANSE